MIEQEKEKLKEEVLRLFKNREPLFGQDGAFAPILIGGGMPGYWKKFL